MKKPRVKVPEFATAGEIITIKSLISHRMESGQRTNVEGNIIPRNIVNYFKCEFNGETVFACDLDSAMSTNPYFVFNARVDKAGTFKFTWIDDNGRVVEKEKSIALT